MRRTFKAKSWGLFLVCLIFIFGLASVSSAAVIFETNFDAHADWNTSGQYNGYECSVLGASNSANVCSSSSYPADWEAFRSMPYNSTSNGMVSIGKLPSSLADHTTGSGKAAIYRNHSNPSFNGGWPGDAILVKYFGGNTYSELYSQLWIRTQPSWHWASRGTTMSNPALKFFRIGNWKGLSSTYQAIFYIPDTHPQMFIDLTHLSGGDGITQAYRCDPSDYYCDNVSNAYQKVDSPLTTKMFSDGNWHLIKFHTKLNTAGKNNGVMEMWQDGSLVYQKTDVQWNESSSTVKGFSHLMLGGNSDNPWSSSGEQWYAVDDVVVSTTDISDKYIPGGGSSPVCGNGTKETGEACDDGTNNGVCPKTCSATCTTNTCQAAPPAAPTGVKVE